MHKRIEKLSESVNQYLSEYKKDFAKITRRCEKYDSFDKAVHTNNFCDEWPLQNRYQQFDFLKGKKRVHKEKIILMYGIQRFIEFENILENLNYDKPYSLYLFFQGDEYFFKKGNLLWPRICFCNDKKEINTYDKNTWIYNKGESIYAKHIEKLMKELEILNYFDIIEYKAINPQLLYLSDEDVTVVIDFKDKIKSKKFNMKELLAL
jgi:hypothetical protein